MALSRQLRELERTEVLFDRFGDFLAQAGQIVDASRVPAPIQRNRREENRRIKQGEVPQDWSEAKSEQKDVDAKHTPTRSDQVTPANAHDSHGLGAV